MINFSINAFELYTAVYNLSKFNSGKSAIPILDDFLFEVTGNSLRVTCTDLVSYVTAELYVTESNTDIKASFIGPKALLKTLKIIGKQIVTIEHNDKCMYIKTKDGEVHKILTEIDPNEFPIQEFSADTDECAEAIVLPINGDIVKMYGLFTRPKELIRLYQSSLMLHVWQDRVDVTSCDGNRLITTKHDIENPVIQGRFNQHKEHKEHIDAPVKIMLSHKDLSKVLWGKDSDSITADIVLDARQKIAKLVRFTRNGYTYTFRSFDCKPPNFTAVIPLSNDKRLRIENPAEFITTIKKALISSSLMGGVDLMCSTTKVVLTSEDIDLGTEFGKELPYRYEGDDIEIGFNGKYLAILMGVQNDPIDMELSTPTRAMVMRFNNTTLLLMPLMKQ